MTLNKLSLLAATAVVLLLAQSAYPATNTSFEKNFYTIKEVIIEPVSLPEDEELTKRFNVQPWPQHEISGEINFTEIVNIGKEVWQVIASNKPVANVSTSAANAWPLGVEHWQQMDGWKPLKSQGFRVTYKNVYNISVVDFTFRVSYFHGGGIRGKGQYLANVTVLPANLSVVWGYTFDAAAKIPAIVNIGSADQPQAGMQVDLHWSVDTVVKHEENTMTFMIYGDGRIEVH